MECPKYGKRLRENDGKNENKGTYFLLRYEHDQGHTK